MRLLTFNARDGQPHIGVVRDNNVIDLSIWLGQNTPYNHPEPMDMLYLIKKGEGGLAMVNKALALGDEELAASSALLTFDQSLLLAPIPRPDRNVLCIGRNYPEHAQESARAFGEAPPEPPKFLTVFTKATTAVNGPYADIPYDASVTEQLDWEAELAVIIGKAGKKISREKALDHVYGYSVLNDISARDIQVRHGSQFFLGKSLDGACPIGPWIVTTDEIPDPGNLELWTRVNGRIKQRANTSQMTFDVPAIIEAISLTMTLEPGDIIATGTPDGIGHARVPAEYLHPGDVVECGVERIGAIRNRVVETKSS